MLVALALVLMHISGAKTAINWLDFEERYPPAVCLHHIRVHAIPCEAAAAIDVPMPELLRQKSGWYTSERVADECMNVRLCMTYIIVSKYLLASTSILSKTVPSSQQGAWFVGYE